MQRREFITLLGGVAAVWPRAAGAQQAAMPVVGYLGPGSPEQIAHLLAAFRNGLGEMGYVEGRNVAIEFRFAHFQLERLPDLAADLIRQRVAVIATPGSSASPLAAKALTTTIPIVFSTSTDPVQSGLVASLNRPGGNVTGIASMGIEIGGKQVGLLRELLPRATRFAALVNSDTPVVSEPMIKEMQAAASAAGRQIEILTASTNREIDAAFAKLVQMRAEALLVSPANLFTIRRVQITTLATRHAVPAIYPLREYVEAGGLMSYGTSAIDQYRQVGMYTGRILKGEKPFDLPVMQPTKFEFVINLQTARTLGITIPPTLLALAEEVIE
jgi:putative tryptophan/tyrosine transport system substrate-binding protein